MKFSLSFQISYRGQNFDAALLAVLVHHLEDHLLVGLGVGGVGPERELRLEHSLALQA